MNGIQKGMVMQRNADGVSQIYVYDVESIESASYEGACSGKMKWERTDDRWCLTGIPVGGPYTVTVNEVSFSDIYVGDVWLLAGQSNMEGVGWLTQEDRDYGDDPRIRAFYMTDQWRPARHRLHRPWLAVDKFHTEVFPSVPGNDPENRGVGPGLAFAQKMQEATGVPQGVICCAHGGTTLTQWDTDQKDRGPDVSIFAALVRRFQANGAHVRGMFWYQGCSEAMSRQHETFGDRTRRFFEGVRAEVGNIPIVQVQIGNVAVGPQPEWDHNWACVREHQRTLSVSVPLLDTVSAIGTDRDDAVHLSSAEQKRIGTAAAESMCALLGDDRFLPAPAYRAHKIRKVWLDGMCEIEVCYDNIWGDLRAEGRPCGFSIGNTPEKPVDHMVCKVTLEGDRAYVRINRKAEDLEGWYLFYGYGVDPYCNITDAHGRRIPAMGPVRLCPDLGEEYGR